MSDLENDQINKKTEGQEGGLENLPDTEKSEDVSPKEIFEDVDNLDKSFENLSEPENAPEGVLEKLEEIDGKVQEVVEDGKEMIQDRVEEEVFNTKQELVSEILEKIHAAKKGALDIGSEDAFIQEYAALCSDQYVPDRLSQEELKKLEQMSGRVKKAIASVETVAEFRLLLENIDGLPPEYIEYALAHENAHMNVAEQKESIETHGYGVAFFKADNEIQDIQPVVITEKVGHADMVEFLTDTIDVLSAPDTYDNKISEDDHVERKRFIHIKSRIEEGPKGLEEKEEGLNKIPENVSWEPERVQALEKVDAKEKEKNISWIPIEGYDYKDDGFYRVVNTEAYLDYLESDSVRPRPKGVELYARKAEGKKQMNFNMLRPTPFPSFQKGYPLIATYGEPGDINYIFETLDPLYAKGETNPVTGKVIANKHFAWRPIDENTGHFKSQLLSSSISKIFKLDENKNLFMQVVGGQKEKENEREEDLE